MAEQQPSRHKDVAGTIELPTATWVRLITLQRLQWPNDSKRTVVIDLITDAHDKLLEDMADLMEGKNND